MDKLHPGYDFPQMMMRDPDGTCDWVYNHDVREGDEIVESYRKNPETGELDEVRIKIAKLVDKGVGRGDFSNWSRPPFWFRGVVEWV